MPVQMGGVTECGNLRIRVMQFRKPLLLGGPLRPVEGHLHDVAKPDLCVDGNLQRLQ